jgi:PhnB protein
MTTHLYPYLNFSGNAREAMEYYKGIFGGKLTMNTFAESGVPTEPSKANQLMHSELKNEGGITFMASDAMEEGLTNHPKAYSMSVHGEDEQVLTEYFTKLCDSKPATQELVETPWGAKFGIVIDKFGIKWLFNINK